MLHRPVHHIVDQSVTFPPTCSNFAANNSGHPPTLILQNSTLNLKTRKNNHSHHDQHNPPRHYHDLQYVLPPLLLLQPLCPCPFIQFPSFFLLSSRCASRPNNLQFLLSASSLSPAAALTFLSTCSSRFWDTFLVTFTPSTSNTCISSDVTKCAQVFIMRNLRLVCTARRCRMEELAEERLLHQLLRQSNRAILRHRDMEL